jgi:hypothetical protein
MRVQKLSLIAPCLHLGGQAGVPNSQAVSAQDQQHSQSDSAQSSVQNRPQVSPKEPFATVQLGLRDQGSGISPTGKVFMSFGTLT